MWLAGRRVLHDVTWRLMPERALARDGAERLRQEQLLARACTASCVPRSAATCAWPALGNPRDVWELRKQVAWVSPELQAAYRYPSTVRACIASGFTSSVGATRRPTPAEARRVEELLEELELAPLAERLLSTLSYGQARRALLGRLLANRPRVLLLDEPWEGLDAPMAELFNTTLEQSRRRRHAARLRVAPRDASRALHARARARRRPHRPRRPGAHDLAEVPTCDHIRLFHRCASWPPQRRARPWARSAAQGPPSRFEITPYAAYRIGGEFEPQSDPDEADANGRGFELDEGNAEGLILDIRTSAGDSQWEVLYAHQDTQLETQPSFAGGPMLDIDVSHIQFGGTYLFEDNSASVVPFIALTAGLARFEPELHGRRRRELLLVVIRRRCAAARRSAHRRAPRGTRVRLTDRRRQRPILRVISRDQFLCVARRRRPALSGGGTRGRRRPLLAARVSLRALLVSR